MSKRQAREWLAKFIELATAEILAGHDLRITGLGTFYVYRNMRARVTNPRTGAPIAGRMERAIKLRPSQSLRDALN